VPTSTLDPVLNKANRTVLVVDDNEAATLATRKYLATLGYKVVYASSGFEAIESAPKVRPDIIIMDIQMPGMDGLEAIKRLKQLKSVSNVPIIAVTGLAMQRDESRCLKAGADYYLSKPYSIFVLRDAIDSLLVKKAQTNSKPTVDQQVQA